MKKPTTPTISAIDVREVLSTLGCKREFSYMPLLDSSQIREIISRYPTEAGASPNDHWTEIVERLIDEVGGEIPTHEAKPRTVWLVKQTQPDESFIDTTFAVFDNEPAAQECCDWHNEEYGLGDEYREGEEHFYTIEEIEVKTKFTI